jgi:hypothetical protein
MITSKAPRILPSSVYELQLPGNGASLLEINSEANHWAKEQLSKISVNEIRSLAQSK